MYNFLLDTVMLNFAFILNANFMPVFTVCVQIHLSDDNGMEILKHVIWTATSQYLEMLQPKPVVQSRTTPAYNPRFEPRIVVKGVEHVLPMPSSEWTLVRSSSKV